MKRIFIILISTWLCLWLLGRFMDYRYQKFWRPVFDKLDVVFKDTTRYDIIFLGNSRVHFAINPHYVDSITKLKTYNLGMAGASINEINFLGDVYLSNHPAPRYAMIAVGYADILQSYNFFENPCYYLYYLDNKFDYDAFDKLHYHVGLLRVLPVLKYVSFDDFNKVSIAKNLSGETLLQAGGITYHGFINNSTEFFNTNQQISSMQKDTAYQKGIDKLKELVETLKQNNCKPIFVYPPVLNIGIEKGIVFSKIDAAIAVIAKDNNVPIWYYDTDKTFTTDLFIDPWHVNIAGSVVYSKKIGEALKQYIDTAKN